ncbi:hypothetical protein D3C75_1282690 [compost metagenome]
MSLIILVRPSLSAVFGFIVVVLITFKPKPVTALLDSFSPATKVGLICFNTLSSTNASELLK